MRTHQKVLQRPFQAASRQRQRHDMLVVHQLHTECAHALRMLPRRASLKYDGYVCAKGCDCTAPPVAMAGRLWQVGRKIGSLASKTPHGFLCERITWKGSPGRAEHNFGQGQTALNQAGQSQACPETMIMLGAHQTWSVLTEEHVPAQ